MSEEIKHSPLAPGQPAATPPSQRPCQVGHASPNLLAIRLRDARLRYEQAFCRRPQPCDLTGLDGWAQVEWLDQAVATRHVPKLGTYTPPAPYRVFRLVQGARLDQAGDADSQDTPDL